MHIFDLQFVIEFLLSLLSGSHIFSIFVLQCIQHMHCIMGPCRGRRIGASRRRRRWPVRKALQLVSPPAANSWWLFQAKETILHTFTVEKEHTCCRDRKEVNALYKLYGEEYCI